ncbi:enoyl-CoA hydratase-related protein [Nocardioides insulae]|uniref:enoyl-CoA hydratase-related protein n=1 Tax=Nocardioides insulae TaxID=394734 RepID=UPI001B7F8653|nr:enoyl-CoA hydratase-related protein [Nocardioides insulae]
MTHSDVVHTECVDGILLIEMRRERQRNAVDRSLADALSEAFDRVDDDPSVRVGILSGAGPVFSAGTDLKEGRSPATDRGGEYGLVRRRRTKPVIAALEGPALGGGFELVLSCDLVVASTTASFGLPEVKRGLVAACGGLFRTPHALPATLAAELLLTGESISAERAAAHGLVNRVTEPGQAVAEARRLAALITQNAPDAVSASLRALHDARATTEATGWPATDLAIARIAASPDRAEGVAAFLEKRPPRWQQH